MEVNKQYPSGDEIQAKRISAHEKIVSLVESKRSEQQIFVESINDVITEARKKKLSYPVIMKMIEEVYAVKISTATIKKYHKEENNKVGKK